MGNGIPLGFKELDPKIIREATEGHECMLDAEQKKAEALYQQHRHCPNGCGPTMEKHAGSVAFAFGSSDWSVPRCLMRCHACGCIRNPFDGMIVEVGDPNKAIYGNIPLIDPKSH